MLKRILFFICFPFLLIAEQSKANDPEDRVEVLSDLHQTPTGVVAGCVNVISGHYFLTETDHYVPGTNPIVFQRFYNSGNLGQGRFCTGWDDNYSYTAIADGTVTGEGFVLLKDGAGSFEYTGKRSNKKLNIQKFSARQLKWGITNGTSDTESGKYNLLNRKVYVRSGKHAEIEVKHENGDLFSLVSCSVPDFYDSCFMRLYKRTLYNGCSFKFQYQGQGVPTKKI